MPMDTMTLAEILFEVLSAEELEAFGVPSGSDFETWLVQDGMSDFYTWENLFQTHTCVEDLVKDSAMTLTASGMLMIEGLLF